ncbi:hypothetical protein [Aquimarina aggregata]|nr:hypothetical protein [Aquimarina aggregata]
MMNAIDKIFSNQLGISFFWKKEEVSITPRIQLVFKDIGFLLSVNELKDFSNACTIALQTQCAACKTPKTCRSLLLKTPSDKIDLAVNKEELDQIKELINETIFRVELKNWMRNLCLN